MPANTQFIEEKLVKTISLLFIPVVALCLMALSQVRASTADDETRLIQLEHAWNQAEATNSADAIISLFEETLVYVDYDGSVMNKTEYLHSVSNPPSKADHLYDEGMKAHIYGDAGIVTGVYRETGVQKGKPYTRRARFTDTWIKRDGQWRCAASQSTLIQ